MLGFSLNFVPTASIKEACKHLKNNNAIIKTTMHILRISIF